MCFIDITSQSFSEFVSLVYLLSPTVVQTLNDRDSRLIWMFDSCMTA